MLSHRLQGTIVAAPLGVARETVACYDVPQNAPTLLPSLVTNSFYLNHLRSKAPVISVDDGVYATEIENARHFCG